MFSQIVGLEQITQRLTQAISSGSMASAYLFVGKQGRGKSFLARQLAQTILCCNQNACNSCASCSFLKKDNHPDFLVLKQRKNFIEISQIQELSQEIIMPPVVSAFRVVFVKEVENMNIESANAFLKILEEPPTSCRFVLSTTNDQAILDTIASRCQKIFFPEFSLFEVEKIILQTTNLQREVVKWSFPFHKSGIQKEWLPELDKFFQTRQTIWELLSVANLERFTELLNFGESQEKENTFFACFFFVLAFFYDLWLFSLQKDPAEEFLYSPDLQNLTKKAISRYNLGKIYKLFQNTLQVEASIKKFINKPLGWNSLIIQIKNSLS